MSFISIQNLTKTFGDNLIFKDVNIDVEKKDSIVIIGPSGCGKSTLLRCINKMETPDSGKIFFDGIDILNPKINIDKIRSRVGMVYQNFNIFSHLNALENVILAPMKIQKMPLKEAIEKGESLLNEVGLYNRRYHMPNQLSGGQKQRLAIARCLAMDPEVILFDEPTSALDPTMVDEVENVIKKLVINGMTSIIVTHEMSFAESVSNKIVYLDDHGVYESGTPQQIFHDPKREKTGAFINKLNTFEKIVTWNELDMYSFISEVSQYCIPYGITEKQKNIINTVQDELIYPILRFDKEQPCRFRLRCSSKSAYKDIYVEFPDIKENPMENGALDELNIKILKNMLEENDFTIEDNNAVLNIKI